MGNIIVSGVINKGGLQPFNAIEFYAVGQGDSVTGAGLSVGGDYCDYFLLQQGGVPESGTNLRFNIDSSLCSNVIATGAFWRITNDAAAFMAYFGVPADYVDPNLSRFDGTNIVDLFGPNPGGLEDRYGEIGTNSWNYVGGWAYRDDGDDTGNDTFDEANWSINQDRVASCTTNDTCGCRFPLGTYNPTGTGAAPVCTLPT
jgi:hypothetical protein